MRFDLMSIGLIFTGLVFLTVSFIALGPAIIDGKGMPSVDNYKFYRLLFGSGFVLTALGIALGISNGFDPRKSKEVEN